MRRLAALFARSSLAAPLLAATRTWTGTTSGTRSAASDWGATVPSGGNLVLTSIGTINTPIVVNSGGTLTVTPGLAPLTNKTVTLNSGGVYAITINGSASNLFSRMTSNAGVTIAGNLLITSST